MPTARGYHGLVEVAPGGDMEFQVLGPIRLRPAGRAVEVGEPRRQAVLAVLLLEAGRTVGVDTLVDRVWGDSPPRQARRSLQAHITRIRRLLEQADPGGAQVVRDAGGYRLVVRPEQVDVFRFRRVLHDHASDAAALRTALGLWQGEPLAGLRGHWAERTREALQRQQVVAAVALADAEIRRGAAASTISWLTELTGEHPLDETVAAALMRALYAVDRGADALVHFERTRAALREELGADPGPTLTAVHEAVLRHDLRPAPAPAVPAQLPADVTAFTGRADELSELDKLTSAAGVAPVVICLTGTAGAGKTAMAIRWGHHVADRFPGGQLYLDLRGYDPGEPMRSTDALAVLLTALLPAGNEIPLRPEERSARYRTEVAGRRMLVILDNAATVEQIRPLLPGTHHCVVVVTSRDSLAGLVALHGAHRIGVGPMPAAEAVALLRRLIGDRVDAEPASARALAERCAWLPLTLRLAAEQAVSRPDTTLNQLTGELCAAQRTLDLLSSGSDQRAAVRAVFSWSMRGLSVKARRAFAAIGCHPAPSFDEYALAALVDRPLDETRLLLTILVNASLVHRVGIDRYGMHDLLKAYAQEVEGDLDGFAALARLYGFCLATVAAAMDRLYPGEAHRRPPVTPPAHPVPALLDRRTARDWLDAELPTLQVLVGYAAAHDQPRDAVRLAALLFRYLDGHHEAAALSIYEHAGQAARILGDRVAEADARIALGAVHGQAGRGERAAEEIWAAHALFDEAGDLLGQARAVGNAGMLEECAGRYLSAVEYFTRSLGLFGQVGDLVGQAHILTRLGTVETRLGRDLAGERHLRQALVLHEDAGHRFGEAWVMIGLAELSASAGRTTEAVALLTEAAGLFGQLGHRESEAWAIDGLGRAEAMSGHPFDAVAHHRQALVQFRRHGNRVGESWALNGLGEACQACGQLTIAQDSHAEALAVATAAGCHEQLARAHRGLAAVSTDLATAERHHDQAIAIQADLGWPPRDLSAFRRTSDSKDQNCSVTAGLAGPTLPTTG